MNSRSHQNILHIVGTLNSVLTIFGAIVVGSGNYYGVLLMILGALFLRVSSEVEFRKMGKLIQEGILLR